MIVIRVREDGVTVYGHAGFAEVGKDIICAGVTALTQTLIKSLNDLTKDKIEYEIWNPPDNICKGLNYWLDFHYGMKIQMNKVKQDKEICLFTPSVYFVTIKINSTSDDIKTISRTGKIKNIDVQELNDLTGFVVQPYIIIIPPSESRTLELYFESIEETDDVYCHARAIEEYGENQESLFKYEMPFDYSCSEEEEKRLIRILYASIVATIAASIIFTIEYFPYFCPKKPS